MRTQLSVVPPDPKLAASGATLDQGEEKGSATTDAAVSRDLRRYMVLYGERKEMHRLMVIKDRYHNQCVRHLCGECLIEKCGTASPIRGRSDVLDAVKYPLT